MTGGRSGSAFWRAVEIILRRARAIKDLGVDGWGYYALIEFTDGSHYPYPMLGRVLRWFARRLPVLGVRGDTWFYHCPVCGARSFYTFRADYCSMCCTAFDESLQPYDLDGPVLREKGG